MHTDLPTATRTHYLERDHGHRLWIAEYGAPDSPPLLMLHGGPGSGAGPRLATLCALETTRLILPDQRGAGRSKPAGCCIANTTETLIEDLESIRQALAIPRWTVAGGSWGATLALCYAARHPHAVCGLALRNPFLARAADLDNCFNHARSRFPAAWQAWRALGAPENGSFLPWLSRHFARLPDTALTPWLIAWHQWESALAGLAAPPPPSATEITALAQRYRLQIHYLSQQCFLAPDAILSAARQIARHRLPVEIVQGLDDALCPPAATRQLTAALPQAGVSEVADAGHNPFAPAMLKAWLTALKRLQKWETKC